ncbi:MAG TPA: hypothetical protein VJ746_08880 [Nitrospira sp.]|nr:hypothetical protein [Nitrospira sp.]
MKLLFYSGLVLLLVPLHTTILPHVSVWGVKPDVGLVVATLIGLTAGEAEGLAIGLAIGWVLNMYSAGELWLSLVTKGGAGLLAGLLGRHVAQISTTVLCVGLLVLSLAGGTVTALVAKSDTLADTWWMVQSIVLPQAIFDAAVGTGLFWIVRERMMLEWTRGYERYV